MSSPEHPAARFDWLPETGVLRLSGAWITSGLAHAEADLARFSPEAATLTIDAGGLLALDTAGALVLYQMLEALQKQGRPVELTGLDEPHALLLDMVRERADSLDAVPGIAATPRLEQVGRTIWETIAHGYAGLSFIGMAFLGLLRSVVNPKRLRWRAILAVIQTDGVGAMPVLGMLSFLVGVVIAYQAGVQLRLYGGNIYVVDLVTLTVLRELGPMMTAIVVAGRSGSAYAAQIGTMQVTEEVDALRSMGLPPMEILVLPKVLGLLVALPLLTVFADVMAVIGGMVMAATMLSVEVETFTQRIPEAVSISSLMTGIGKAPVFAAVIATVGCYQGFQVSGGADSVGRHTTTSVVQAIVLVILVDAAFSVVYSWLGI
ncbi:MAG: MlaE family lipid ABC transporter permease subunit [Chromatiaceae bacterium]